MCEFCTKHGEGKKWYLQMKNYSDELLHEELSAHQRDVVGVKTRLEWGDGFWSTFIRPAATGLPQYEEARNGSPPSAAAPTSQPSDDEVVARRMVEHFGQVLPLEDVERVIDIADSITRMPCGCRFLTTGKTDKRYCFGIGIDRMGILGRYPDAASSLEVLDKADARKAFRAYDQEGLVHSVWTGVTPYVIGMCNCDRDCGAYKGYIEEQGTPQFFRAEYVCEIDCDLCTGCKACISQCQFGAQFYSSGLRKVYIDPRRCFGCGVCRAACVDGAISLVPRRDIPQAAELWLGDPLG